VQLQDLSQVSLFQWTQTLADYGISNLFTNYLVEQFDEIILNDIYDNVSTEVGPIDIVKNNSGKEISEIFMNFIIANKLHSLELADEYSYELPLEGDPLHTPVTSQYSGYTPEIRNSAVKYYMIEGTGTDVELNIVGSITEQKVGAFIYRY
jgi:hypothetical protein